MIELAKKILQLFRHRSAVKSDESRFREKPLWLKSYEPGVPANIHIPDCSIVAYLKNAAEQSPDVVFVNYFNKKLSYSAFYRSVLQCAEGLRQKGVRPQDRIVIILPNIPQLMIAYWAVLSLGAVAVLINPVLSPRELKQQIQQVTPKVIMVFDKILARLDKIPGCNRDCVYTASVDSYFPAVKRIVYQMAQTSGRPRISGSKKLHATSFRLLLGPKQLSAPAGVSSDSPAVMLFTGGVTGSPKATVLTHKNIVANTLQGIAWLSNLNPCNEVILGALPFVHSYGLTSCHHLAVMTQSTILLQPGFNIRKIIKDVRHLGVTIFPGVPTMFQAFLDHYDSTKKDRLQLKLCISGGAPLPSGLQKDFFQKYHINITQGYGLSEASPITHCNPVKGKKKLNSIGVPWPNTLAVIRHLQTGKKLSCGETGELWVNGPQVMKEYYNWPEETSAVLKEGWLATGDIAYYDEDGYFYIVDRKKDIILSGGQNIFPAEVESVLLEHPAVKEVSIVGEPDSYLGEVVKAAIVTHKGRSIDFSEIHSFCSDKLAKYKIPQRIEFYDELPKNFLGKVLKRELHG